MDLNEKTINTQTIFEGEIIKIIKDEIKLPNGKHSFREVVEHKGGVCVAPLTQNNEFVFVKQYRYPYKKAILELPAGKLEIGSDPLENGKRELKEEIGAIGKNYISLGNIYPSPGYCGEIIYLYFCNICNIGENCPDENEFLEIIKIPLEKSIEMVFNNKISDAKTQIALLKSWFFIKNKKIW